MAWLGLGADSKKETWTKYSIRQNTDRRKLKEPIGRTNRIGEKCVGRDVIRG